ncbi:uncharacterized protein K441DRAFT_665708 [Cenococcum geophilum 1.58]|uniref:uncharacterized protein n=1 Tax=Cenococcum geophilum 1.58 TaxID=794803 RepID=UPI00358F3A55|nr:hypothetical protein K441DRAFT_665708 [Cenococcum geophilum 1.58]
MHTRSYNNAASSCEPSDGNHISSSFQSSRFSSFQSLKVLVLTVLGPSYLYPLLHRSPLVARLEH